MRDWYVTCPAHFTVVAETAEEAMEILEKEVRAVTCPFSHGLGPRATLDGIGVVDLSEITEGAEEYD